MLRQEIIETAGCGRWKEDGQAFLAAQGDGGLDHILQRRLTFGLQPPPGSIGDAGALGGFKLRPAQGDAPRLDATRKLMKDFDRGL
ncbi:MAG: hypothetical protein Q8N10_07755 [Phenylobacterium sp.]|uniref:hypothetical protein n=1 Tax=Phenylobacterium sp. TaxID=1871053 RepID=UPI0027269C90|nr:hypothetical protein [Phenylobacterium sp.]MDO8913941.1 hypothetical protein [Phenylobacterium sp.]MDP3100376.1 hypothetical protein [Phenylobacterium sp.]HQT53810.1 hypothetical protein [Phenylobacterium sp.]